MAQLTFQDHSRIFANHRYIYPVVSRRSQGVSLGINLNINNACNWRCIYCQVEGLVRGNPQQVDLVKLESELTYMLEWITQGDFMQKYAPIGLQRFNDICFSGNGESTLSKQFLPVMEIVAKLRAKYYLQDKVKTVLITNGSEVAREDILTALAMLQENNGEVWFKVDSASWEGINKINQVNLSLESVTKRLQLAAGVCKTYIQTCLFKIAEQDPKQLEIDEYINLVAQVRSLIAGVFLYSTARNPALPEGQHISQVSEEFLASVAARLRQLGVTVQYYT
ncbi:MAG: hypothetical protein ACK4M7_02480 [Burkholderiales bacterium]